MATFNVSVLTGLAWTYDRVVEAQNAQEAADLTADYLEASGFAGLYDTYGDLEKMAREEHMTVDEYAEYYNLTCCGNHGIYVAFNDIREVAE